MNRTRLGLTTLNTLALSVLVAAVACGGKKSDAPAIQTAVVTRRDIVVTAQATGTVEPIDTVAVKSQASGLIIQMPVDVGSTVKPGDLLAQIDTRQLKNDYDRSVAAQAAAKATLTVDNAALQRANSLYSQKVITADEHEAAVVAQANASSALISAQTQLSTSQQNLEYATVRSEVSGTVISKGASVGTVVSSAVSTFGGGSTVLTIANLERVRMRAFVNETDIGNVHAGMPVQVTVDAFAGRTFQGSVEKVEPQAVIQQSVTMFPVLVSLENLDQSLLPGMNGEVSIVTQQQRDVLAVPNDAVRSTKDVATAATALGISADSLKAIMAARRGGAGGAGAPGASGNAGANAGTGATTSGNSGASAGSNAAAGGAGAGGTRGAGGPGGGSGGGGFSRGPQIQVADSACKIVMARVDATHARAAIDSLRQQMRAGTIDTTAMRTKMADIYKRAKLNPDTTRACMFKAAAARGGFGGTGGAGGSGRGQVVFVKEGKGWVPHTVRLGASDFDYSAVTSGLAEGDTVALLGAAVLQAQRDQASQRARAITGAGLPGGSTTPAAGARPATGGAAGGGGGGRP